MANRLPWNDTWMLQALLWSCRSPDPNTKVGSCLVSPENKQVASGYNGLPKGIGTAQIPWDRKGLPEATKYPYIIHAERNAINNAVTDTKGCKCYVTLFPCNECAKDLIQAGVREIIYLDDKYHDDWTAKVARHMLNLVDIKFRQHKWETHEAEDLALSIVNMFKPSEV